MGMLIDRMQQDIKDNMLTSEMLGELMNPLKALKARVQSGCNRNEVLALLEQQTEGRRKAMESLQKAGALSARDKNKSRSIIRFLAECEKQVRVQGAESSGEAFAEIKERFDAKVADYKQDTAQIKEKMHYLFRFVEDTFGSGNEMLILVTECTVQADCAKFIGMYGCGDYQRHNEELMLTERSDELVEQIKALEI